MKTFTFNLHGAHESHTGAAQILEPNDSVNQSAKEAHNHNFPTVRTLGEAEHEGTVYKVYETYTDSGSDDYIYFATPLYQIENK